MEVSWEKWAMLVLLPIIGLILVFFIRAEIYYPNPKGELPSRGSCYKLIKGFEMIQRFSSALQFKTVSTEPHVYDRAEMMKFATFLRRSFPRVFSSPIVKFEKVKNFSLLFYVKGSDPTLAPYLLCSHLDVVPVQADQWEVDPFSGKIKNNFVYGRGAVDVKDTLMAIMESLNYLLSNKFEFKRSIWIAFGHDEEVGGADGASNIAKTFADKGITKFEYLLDEGLVIFNSNFFPGIKRYFAIVGVSEKGTASVVMNASTGEGHSSTPAEETAITVLARAVSKLTASCQPSYFGKGPERDMFDTLALYASYPYRLVYSNLWFFRPFLVRYFSKIPSLNAIIRTTTAVTMISGGSKENVVPGKATAIINHRIHSAQTIQNVLDIDKELVNDNRITLTLKHGAPTHPISPHGPDAFGYQCIKQAISQVFKGTVVVPGVLTASTDTRWYLKFTNNVYRFSPLIIENQEDVDRIHGHNERISVRNYFQIVNFYHQLMIYSNQKNLANPPTSRKSEL